MPGSPDSVGTKSKVLARFPVVIVFYRSLLLSACSVSKEVLTGLET